jgi:O-acetyl-ADP-ribose deacetylase (regulator of RNase III)
MLKFVTGDLLNSGAEGIVNAVNTVGVMGKGIALQFKQLFPYNFKEYKKACEEKLLKPGVLLVVKDRHPVTGDKTIINFPTKVHWKNPSKMEYVEMGLVELRKIIPEYGLRSIAVPALGCGAGGLKWEVVKALIQQYLADVDGEVFVYEPL